MILNHLILYFDGASKGNPGKSGAGSYIVCEPPVKNFEFRLFKSIPNGTNNQAEYRGLILGLQKVHELLRNGFAINLLVIKGDSNLVINQILGKWKINSDNLKLLYSEATRFLNRITNFGVEYKAVHIRRNLNFIADRLANLGVKK